MTHAILLSLTLVSGLINTEHNYDVVCISPKKGDISAYSCTLSSKDLSPDPKTCRNFAVKDVRAINARKLQANLLASCREFQGHIELEVSLQADDTIPSCAVESSAAIQDPGHAVFVYDDEPAID